MAGLGLAVHLEVAGEGGLALADVGLVLLGVGAEEGAGGGVEDGSAGLDGVQGGRKAWTDAGDVEAHGAVWGNAAVLLAGWIMGGGILPEEGEEAGGLADGERVLGVSAAALGLGVPLAERAAVRGDGSVGYEDGAIAAGEAQNEANLPHPPKSTQSLQSKRVRSGLQVRAAPKVVQRSRTISDAHGHENVAVAEVFVAVLGAHLAGGLGVLELEADFAGVADGLEEVDQVLRS